MTSMIKTLLAFTAAASIAGCTTDQYGNQHASRGLKGAAIGGAGGAAVSALAGGDVLAGAALGAAAGAVIGIVTDDHNRYEDRSGYRTYYDRDGRPYRYDNNRQRYYLPR